MDEKRSSLMPVIAVILGLPVLRWFDRSLWLRGTIGTVIRSIAWINSSGQWSNWTGKSDLRHGTTQIRQRSRRSITFDARCPWVALWLATDVRVARLALQSNLAVESKGETLCKPPFLSWTIRRATSPS